MAIEIFKVKIGIAPIIMNEVFSFVENSTYNLRSGMHLSRVNVHSIQYGTESIGYLGGENLESCYSPYERFKGPKYI